MTFWLVSIEDLSARFLCLSAARQDIQSLMKREAQMLLEKAGDSLLLGIEKFNCPFERGRVTSVLIALDHAFEMLLKASILQRGGRIRKRGAAEQACMIQSKVTQPAHR